MLEAMHWNLNAPSFLEKQRSLSFRALDANEIATKI